MTKNINPFIVTGKIPKAYFCDRDAESAQLIRFLGSQENVVLMSQRRMGKTKLVLEYDLLTRRDGLYTIADPLMALWMKSRRL